MGAVGSLVKRIARVPGQKNSEAFLLPKCSCCCRETEEKGRSSLQIARASLVKRIAKQGVCEQPTLAPNLALGASLVKRIARVPGQKNSEGKLFASISSLSPQSLLCRLQRLGPGPRELWEHPWSKE